MAVRKRNLTYFLRVVRADPCMIITSQKTCGSITEAGAYCFEVLIAMSYNLCTDGSGQESGCTWKQGSLPSEEDRRGLRRQGHKEPAPCSRLCRSRLQVSP